MSPIAQILGSALQLFNFLLIIWCLCSWFPNIKWYDQPFKTLDMIIRPVIAPFNKIIPPIGGLNLAPMVAILFFQFLYSVIVQFL